jgi:tetratricopeptide (TPR) repeat protein
MAEIRLLRLAARILRFPRNDARSGSRYRDEAEQFTIRGFKALDAYGQAGDPELLDVAVAALRNAEAITPPGHPGHVERLANLAEALFARFERTAAAADVDAAIDATRRAVDLTRPGHPSRAALLSNLGAAFLSRFELAGKAIDLDTAVQVGEQAVDLTSLDDPGRAERLSNLANALRGRFGLTGDIADLNAAVEANRQAVDLTPDDHVNLALYLSNLANVLRVRAEHTQNVADPGDAVDACRRAVDLTPPGHPNRPGYLSNLGNALQARFWLTEDIADLNAAVEAAQRAVDLTPPGYPDLVLHLVNLANALIGRFAQTANAADLNAAVEAGQRTVALTPPGHPNLARNLSNLAVSLRARYEQAGDTADLDTAIDHWRKAVALAPPGHPNLPLYLSNQADALNVRYERTKDDRDLDAALGCWQRASAVPAGIPGIRLAAAQNLAVTASDAGRTREGAEGFAQAVALLPEVAWQGMDRASRERQLAHWYGLAANAAACAIADNRADLAVELLEQGRSVLWSQALALRGDLSRLVSTAPHLAERLSVVRAGLDAPLSGSSASLAGIQWNEHERASDDRQVAHAIDRRMALAREWDDLVQQVRKVEGFEDFLRTPRLEHLLPAGEVGPVVIVNVSPWRCDALIVTTAGVKVENLAGLTSEAVTAQARRYLDGLLQMEEAAHASSQSRPGTDRSELPLHTARDHYEQILSEVTAWLWDQIAGPVLAALAITDPPQPDKPWPRLWWCPTGALNLLPLHAAGHHTAEGRARHQSVLDRVVSSYTPTLRALLEAREEATPERPAEVTAASAGRPRRRMLVVGLARTPGQVPLPNVAKDLRLLSTLLPDRHTILDGPAATWDAVRAQLRLHRWVHFSCHADQDLADPSRGGIQLHDRQLTIEDISEGQNHGDFAFLSACRTATGGSILSDEAITLAAALHYTGYRHVIAAQWTIRDRTAADVAVGVYTHLTSTGTFEPSRAAQALHTTIRGLRDAGKPLSQWMQFIHTGP